MHTAPFRWLEHTADIRVRITGRTKKDLLNHAVWALSDAVTSLRTVRALTARTVRVKATTFDLLLAALLKELLFRFDTERFLGRRLELTALSDTMLTGRVWGERFDPRRHPLKTELKAVTYHGLRVRKVRGRWQAEVVFDV